jgi:anti-anti-sigma factor
VDVLSVEGEIDISTAARFQEALSAAVSGGHGPLVLDLSEVTFIDSSAAHVLSTLAGALDAQRRRLAIPDPFSRSGGVADRAIQGQFSSTLTPPTASCVLPWPVVLS